MINGLLLHSVSYSGSWGQPTLTLDDFVDKAADLGFDGVMLMAKRPHLSVLDYGPRECARLRQRITDRGMQKVCIAGYTNFTGDLAHPDIPNREFQIRHIAELARVAHDLGAGTIRVFTVEHMRLTFMCLVLGHLQAEPLSPRCKMAVPWQ